MLKRSIAASLTGYSQCLLCGFLIAVLTSSAVQAKVIRFEITARQPFAGGMSFGAAGSYERIEGNIVYELDPTLPQNAHVIDLDKAPRNARGQVEVRSQLFLLTPSDPSRGNGALLYDVNNRGNKLALRFFNFAGGTNDPRTADDAGDGFLLRHGFTVVWSGWDGELLPGNNRLRLTPPVARDGDQPILGRVRCEIVPNQDTSRMVINWSNHGSYRPTPRGLQTATLTHRLLPGDSRIPIAGDLWRLHVSDVESDSPTQLPKIELEYPDGLKRAHIYEVIYEAQDPLVMGTGLTSVRDLISAFKHGEGRDNPLVSDGRAVIKRAHGFGVSQSGRFLREFLYWGFNQDEAGRQVFDGVIPHVSGSGLGSFNHRFAQPTRHAAQHDHHDYPPDRFPFSYNTQTDPISKQTDGILQRSLASKTAPFVLHTQSAAEYWTRSGSLTHTDPLGRRDVPIPDKVRIYLFGGTQHGPSSFPPGKGSGKNLANPGDYRPFLRALLLALDRWAAGGAPAPASVYPTINKGTLVDWKRQSTGFPDIPAVRYPTVIQQPAFLDFGPRWLTKRIVDQQPPVSRGDYRVLVPRCDPDGNEVDCLSPPEVAVPIGTYTGWNLRSRQAGAENELVSLVGSFIPFPVTQAERKASADPRRSVEERYQNLDSYLMLLKAECLRLQKSGYLLPEDAERTVKQQRERQAEVFAKFKTAARKP